MLAQFLVQDVLLVAACVIIFALGFQAGLSLK